MTLLTDLEIVGWAAFACYWISFGAFCVSGKPWGCREVFGATVNSGNAGILMAMFGIKIIGIKDAWTIIALAGSTSIGWIKKSDIRDMILKMLGGK